MALADIDPGVLLSSVYDAPYDAITGAIIEAIVNGSTSGVIAQRLAELEAEAQRLADDGEALTADNAVVRALLADMDTLMLANGALVNSIAPDMMLAGISAGLFLAQELALPGASPALLEAVGWVSVDPALIASALGYVDSEAFAALLSDYSTGTVEQIKNIILNGIVQGKNPLAIARDVTRSVTGLPASNAQQILRTLQLVSSRDAQLEARKANASILEYQIRIAALDARTCMSCVALHGTIYPIDVRIDDHHNGRCTSVTKVVGFDAPDVQTGADWFDNLPDSEQIAMMGNAAWNAWKEGVIALQDFPREYVDDVFGTMIGEHSLIGMIGERAQEFK